MAKIFSSLEEYNDEKVVNVITVDPEKEVEEHDVEINEQVVEINEGIDAVSEAFVAIETMASISNRFSKVLEKEEGISLEAASIAKSCTDNICLKIEYPRSKSLVPALEAFNEQTGLEATKYALESIGDFIAETWEAILKFFTDLKEYISKLWKGLFDANERKKNLIDKYVSQLDTFDNDGWISLDTSEARKRFDGNKNRLLSIQNTFRLNDSNIINNNIPIILNNQKKVTEFDIDKIIDNVTVIPGGNVNDISKSIEALKVMTKSIDTNAFIEGWRLTFNEVNGKQTPRFSQNAKKNSGINSRNYAVANIDTLKTWLSLCSDILSNVNEFNDRYKEYENILDEYINDIREIASNSDNTFTEEERKLLEENVANTRVVKNIVDLVFVKIPSLSSSTVSKTLDVVNFQMSFYVKPKE